MGRSEALGKSVFSGAVNGDHTGSDRHRIDRRMVGILSIFAVLGIIMVIGIVIATNTLSALRGFATLQANWTETRKEAVFHLVQYLQTSDGRHITRYDSARQLIRSAEQARRELLRQNTDREAVRVRLLQIQTSPADIGQMITTFERFHNFPDFSEAIDHWVRSDRLVDILDSISSASIERAGTASLSTPERDQLVERAVSLDRELTREQHLLASSLASGTRLLNQTIVWVSFSIGFILLLTGGLLSFRFLRSIKNWQRSLRISEQQYRSLFEQNPFAVFSIDLDGRITSANRGMNDMTGYPAPELKGIKLEHVVVEAERERVRSHFGKAAGGEPQTFETAGVRKDGTSIYIEMTNLPIYVDHAIVGVYGIAHDITDRRDAELKVKEQLQEKTHLLAEVHDRVKNNLALISSLMQLQEEYSPTPGEKNFLEGTIARIRSIAMVHERMYSTGTFSGVRMDKFAEELVETMMKTYHLDVRNVNLVCEADPVSLNVNRAIPFGLLLNELLVNACKYAHDGLPEGSICVSLSCREQEIELRVTDDGIGISPELDLENPRTLGLTIVKVLIQQLGATFEVSRRGGTTYTIQLEGERGVAAGNTM